MIHPINIPEDLLEVNPKMPTIFAPRKKLIISYTDDGRRLNADDGAPLSATSPNSHWRNFFLRSFVRQLACDNEASEGEDFNNIDSTTRPLIDIVDLQLNDENASNNDRSYYGDNTKYDSVEQLQYLKLTQDKKKSNSKPKIEKNDISLSNDIKIKPKAKTREKTIYGLKTLKQENLTPDRPLISEENERNQEKEKNKREINQEDCEKCVNQSEKQDQYDQGDILNEKNQQSIKKPSASSSSCSDEESVRLSLRHALLSCGRSARLPVTRRVSMHVRHDALNPIFAPCCSTSSTEPLQSANVGYKEFARFDFSHSNIFAEKFLSNPKKEMNGEEQTERKTSIKLIPNAVGSRVWLDQCELAERNNKSASFLNPPPISLTRERLNRSQSNPPHADLTFSVTSVSARRKHLEIAMRVRNGSLRMLRLHVVIHVHEVEIDGESIGGLVHRCEDLILLRAKEELERVFRVDAYDALAPIFRDALKYPLVTLHGRIENY